MHRKMIHPKYPENTKVCNPMQVQRLLKLGWRYADAETAVKEVVEFQQTKSAEIMDAIKTAETQCNTECNKPECCKEQVEFVKPEAPAAIVPPVVEPGVEQEKPVAPKKTGRPRK